MQKCDLFAGDFREVDQGMVKGFDTAASEIFEKTADGNKMISLSDGGEALVVFVADLAVEPDAVFAHKFKVDIFWL